MSTKHSIALTAIAAALALPISSADAAVIGSFDPGFPFDMSGAVTNLGFRGTITLDLSSGCTGASGYIYTGYGCEITAESATIDYYNATLHPHPTTSDILVHTSVDASTFGQYYIYGAYFDDSGNLLAFDSNPSNNIYVSVTDGSPPNSADQIHYNEGATFGPPSTYTDYLNLQFYSNFSPDYVCPDGECSARTALFTTYAESGPPSGPTGTVDPSAFMTNTNRSGSLTSDPATVSISAIPEPESAALALIGLGALAVSRRRKWSRPERQAVASSPTD